MRMKPRERIKSQEDSAAGLQIPHSNSADRRCCLSDYPPIASYNICQLFNRLFISLLLIQFAMERSSAFQRSSRHSKRRRQKQEHEPFDEYSPLKLSNMAVMARSLEKIKDPNSSAFDVGASRSGNNQRVKLRGRNVMCDINVNAPPTYLNPCERILNISQRKRAERMVQLLIKRDGPPENQQEGRCVKRKLLLGGQDSNPEIESDDQEDELTRFQAVTRPSKENGSNETAQGRNIQITRDVHVIIQQEGKGQGVDEESTIQEQAPSKQRRRSGLAAELGRLRQMNKGNQLFSDASVGVNGYRIDGRRYSGRVKSKQLLDEKRKSETSAHWL